MAKLLNGVLALLILTLTATAPAFAQNASVTGTQLRLLRDARIGPNRVAVLGADLLYCYPPTRELIVVPRAYMTDFASVPSGAHHVIDRYGDNIEAAIVHDWLYAVGEPDRRLFADQVFRFALGEQDVSVVKRNLAYQAVRAGGHNAYGSEREWASRFYDPSGLGPIPPPYVKPTSGVVAVVDTCELLESVEGIERLTYQYGSHLWPPVEPPVVTESDTAVPYQPTANPQND